MTGFIIILGTISGIILFVAIYRFSDIIIRLFKKQLVIKQEYDCLLALFGAIGILLLFFSIVTVIWITIVTFFYMEAGSASGVPFTMAVIAFPFAYSLSELLIKFGFMKKYNKTLQRNS